jgi:hypothetical protein
MNDICWWNEFESKPYHYYPTCCGSDTSIIREIMTALNGRPCPYCGKIVATRSFAGHKRRKDMPKEIWKDYYLLNIET